MEKKQRILSAEIVVPEDTNVDEMLVGRTGEILFRYQGEIVQTIQQRGVEVFYQRPGHKKGMKKLIQSPSGGNGLNLNPHNCLDEFDILFATDTNTRNYGDRKISASVSVRCDIIRHQPRPQRLESADVYIRFAHSTIQTNRYTYPEKTMWRKVIELIQPGTENLRPDYKIGFIVDSEQNMLKLYNDRTMPIVDDFLLPPKFSMIYASSDAGKEFLPNKMLALCDKEASLLLDHVLSGKKLDGYITNLNKLDWGSITLQLF